MLIDRAKKTTVNAKRLSLERLSDVGDLGTQLCLGGGFRIEQGTDEYRVPAGFSEGWCKTLRE
jgi:hypothetical protein